MDELNNTGSTQAANDPKMTYVPELENKSIKSETMKQVAASQVMKSNAHNSYEQTQATQSPNKTMNSFNTTAYKGKSKSNGRNIASFLKDQNRSQHQTLRYLHVEDYNDLRRINMSKSQARLKQFKKLNFIN